MNNGPLPDEHNRGDFFAAETSRRNSERRGGDRRGSDRRSGDRRQQERRGIDRRHKSFWPLRRGWLGLTGVEERKRDRRSGDRRHSERRYAERRYGERRDHQTFNASPAF